MHYHTPCIVDGAIIQREDHIKQEIAAQRVRGMHFAFIQDRKCACQGIEKPQP